MADTIIEVYNAVMATVYLETSYVSACVTDRTDAGSLYRREASLDWWNTQAPRHSLYVSAEVLAELSVPSYTKSQEALAFIRRVPLLEISEEVRGLAQILVNEKVMPEPVAGDAVHVAVTCVANVEYLLTWNVRHLANPNKVVHLQAICLRLGLVPPRILTPDMLWEDADD